MKKTILIMASIFILSGCSGGTGKCNDSDIKDLVTDIITSNVSEGKSNSWVKRLINEGSIGNLNLHNIKTSSYDEQNDSYVCEATFSFDVNDKGQSKPIKYKLSYLEDSGKTEASVYGIKAVKNRMIGAAILAGIK